MAWIVTHEPNRAGRDFVVGDIHGYYATLSRLLAHVGFDGGRDRLFSVGDLADRGPDSPRLLDYLAQPWFHAIRGNHEQMLLDAASGDPQAAALWRINGGGWFDDLSSHTRQRVVAAVEPLPLARQVQLGGGVAGLIHAQVLASSWTVTRERLSWPEVADDDAQTVIWARNDAHRVRRMLAEPPPMPPTGPAVADATAVFLGHTPMPGAIRVANTRWIDAGICAGGRLALAELAVDGSVWLANPADGLLTQGWQRLG